MVRHSRQAFPTEVEIDGCTLYHRVKVGRKGGIVALYVRNTLNSYVNTTVKSVTNAESLGVDIVTGGRKIVLGIMYSPPDLELEIQKTLHTDRVKSIYEAILYYR